MESRGWGCQSWTLDVFIEAISSLRCLPVPSAVGLILVALYLVGLSLGLAVPANTQVNSEWVLLPGTHSWWILPPALSRGPVPHWLPTLNGQSGDTNTFQYILSCFSQSACSRLLVIEALAPAPRFP